MRGSLGRKKDIGRANAILIAEYGRRQFASLPAMGRASA